jgi:hypothetical protein
LICELIVVSQLYLCIRAFWDPTLAGLNPTDLHELAARDWARDAQGRTKMRKEAFCHAIFQLCDLWTDTIDERQYQAFLELLLRRLTKPRASDGKRVFRDDSDFDLDMSGVRERVKGAVFVLFDDGSHKRVELGSVMEQVMRDSC